MTYQLELPVDGSEDSEFLKMGMEFGPFQQKDKWRGANLLEGWSVNGDEKIRYICDERKRARAVIYVALAQMRLLCRFRIGRDPYIKDSEENVLFCIWDSNVRFPDKSKVVFQAVHTVPSRTQYEDVHHSRIEIYQNQFEKDARKWLADRYPDWESYSGHWDEE